MFSHIRFSDMRWIIVNEMHVHKFLVCSCENGSPSWEDTCNFRKVGYKEKRVMRATREYGPLFQSIKPFARTHEIMLLLLSIGERFVN